MMVTVPSGSKRMPPISFDGGAVTSRKLPTPSPRSLPRLRLSRLRLREALDVGDLERVLEHARESRRCRRSCPRRSCAGSRAAGSGCACAARCRSISISAAARVDQPLHVVVALGPAGAAIGRDMRGVGEHALGRDFDQRRAVDALHVLHGVERRRHRRDLGEEAAHIAEAGDAHRQEGAVGVERELGGHLVVAAVAVGDEAAGALVGPFDRAAERARGVQHADIFRERRRLHAERAADIAGQDAHLLGLDLENLGHVALHAEHALRGDVQREAAARRIVDADRRARLHRVHHDAAVDELEPRDVRGLGEGGRDLLAVADSDSRARRCPAPRRGGAARRRAPPPPAAPPRAAARYRPRPPRRRPSPAAASRRPRTRSGSPTKRTLSVGSAGRGGLLIGVPSRLLNGTMHLSVPYRGEIGAGIDARARPASCARPRCRSPLMMPCATRLRTITA